ncbi:MAG: hypothetical protein U0T07_09510 [Chitinophagales bacterium]
MKKTKISFLFVLLSLFTYAQKAPTVTYIVTSEKANFHNQADANTIRKGYVLKNDKVQVSGSQGKFVYATYTSVTGKQTKGWLLSAGLKKNISTNKPVMAKFLVKSNDLFFVVNQKEFIVQKEFRSIDLTQESDPDKLAIVSTYGGSGWTTYSATLQKNGDI